MTKVTSLRQPKIMKLKSTTILRTEIKGETQDFEKGDIVNIYTTEGFGKTYTGKITYVDIKWLEVDCSTLYNNDLRRFKFNEFHDIEKVETK